MLAMLHPTHFGKTEYYTYGILIQSWYPWLSDPLDNVQHHFLNWTFRKKGSMSGAGVFECWEYCQGCTACEQRTQEPSSSCFYYNMLSTCLCLCLPMFLIQNTYFLCLIAHMSVFVCKMLPLSEGRFSKTAFKPWKDKEHTQVKDRFWKGDAVLVEVRIEDQHTHSPPPWLHPAEL